jgi:hypothetical protein
MNLPWSVLGYALVPNSDGVKKSCICAWVRVAVGSLTSSLRLSER